MTVDKSLKRLIRARMNETGETYTAARQFFLSSEENIMSGTKYKRVTKAELGFELEIPNDWIEVDPDLHGC